MTSNISCPNRRYTYIYDVLNVVVYGCVCVCVCVCVKGSCGFINMFRNINVIRFLFLTQSTTPFLYEKIHFGVLHMRGTNVTMSDTPQRSKWPYLQVGAPKSVQIRNIRTRVLSLLVCSVHLSITGIHVQLCKLIAYFPVVLCRLLITMDMKCNYFLLNNYFSAH